MQQRDVKQGQKKPSKQLTQRDIEIANFINHVGFCEARHIQRRFALGRRRTYQLIGRLIEMELIKHERIFYQRPGILRLIAKGLGHLPPLDNVSVGTYDHQLKVIDVFLKLTELYPSATWTSERQLRYEKFYDGVGKRGHVADGILLMSEEEQIAIEIELIIKGKERLENILKSYAKTHFKEVWYFCAPSILTAMTAAAARFSYIKIHNIQEFLNGRPSPSP